MNKKIKKEKSIKKTFIVEILILILLLVVIFIFSFERVKINGYAVYDSEDYEGQKVDGVTGDSVLEDLFDKNRRLQTSPNEGVSRDIIYNGYVGTGCTFDVNLSLYNPNQKKFYVIDEAIPNGLNIINPDGGNINTPGRLKWSVYSQTALFVNINHIYSLSSLTPGVYTISGVYTLGDNISKDIMLENSVEVRNPVCGDGVKTCNEACDDNNTINGDGCSSSCTIEASKTYRVFVTSQSVQGNFGGLLQADSICNSLAASRNLGGNWKAWISDSTQSAESRLYHSSTAYKRLDGVVIANDWNDLTDGSLINSININNFGGVVSNKNVWTGTDINGGPALMNCNNWSSNSRKVPGQSGRTSLTNSGWTANANSDCNAKNRLYCIEQP